MRKSLWTNKLFWFSLGATILGLGLLHKVSGWVVEWLWMRQLGYETIFWRLRLTKVALFGLAFVTVLLYCWVNLRILGRNSGFNWRRGKEGKSILHAAGGVEIRATEFKGATIFLSVTTALVSGFFFSSQWDTCIRFYWAEPFGQLDPIFHRDLGFYLFRLPFYELVQNGLVGLTLVIFGITFLGYFYLGSFTSGQQTARPVIRHLSVIFVFCTAAWGWGYYLDRFQLLYSTRGVVYGAGYTDLHVVTVGLWIMLLASVGLSILILLNLFTQNLPSILIGVGSYLLFIVVVLNIVPVMVQRFMVQPNELELEKPYLQHNISFTQRAYLLDQIQQRAYPALTDLTLSEIYENQQTLRNIRLWDWRPLLHTYQQIQEIRLYYRFYEMDVDRYHLGRDYRQVMLSARELAEELPEKARTWVNRHLQFTHGYGLAMSLVSQEGEEGLPRFVIKDLPPVTTYQLKVEQPAIYFGEHMGGYRVVTSGVKEFDYPQGDQNVYTNYRGTGGVRLDKFWKRVLFAWNFFDINILLSSYITPKSRIQMWRKVRERVAKIAPFLKLDKDPYPVLSQSRLYWIQDGYTISSYFPYSEPYKTRLNYIRNSVKISMDAYHGSVTFYVLDNEDPVLRVYRRAFPGAFKELAQMSQDLRVHLRYPKDLFTMQVEKFKDYHMTIPQVFYNKEDLWTPPQEKYAGEQIEMKPYYILMKLPGEKDLQYLLMTPLTPASKDNMVAWVAAKSDFPAYGEIIAYKLPKDRLIYGPIQIEALIDQDTLISRQLSLWDQRGSKVIRGNLLVIPIDHSFLYVEPVYLIAEGINIPELKRIIVAYGGRVAMESTLDKAIRAVFGAHRPKGRETPGDVTGRKLTRESRRLERRERLLQRAGWPEFGETMSSMRKILAEQS